MSYKDNPMYGRMKQKEAAIRSGSNYAVQQPAYTDVDRAYEQDEQTRNLQLMQMGEQKRQFGQSLAESSRQFSVRLGVAQNTARWNRKQNRKAEFLGLFNIALGVGSGLVDFMNKKKYVERQQAREDAYDRLIGITRGAQG